MADSEHTFDFPRTGVSLDLGAPRIMGILNTTPDSFSDGGKFDLLDKALSHALAMESDGASIIDIGGESTRPGADPVSVNEELDRVIPVIEAIRNESSVIISVDTSKPVVMQEAVNAGADIINDVRALQNHGALEVAAKLQVPVCLMHMQGTPDTMQLKPAYHCIVDEIKGFLKKRIEVCIEAGISPGNLIIDPGFGFGKTLDHNVQLLKSLSDFSDLGAPLLVGVSRKSMIGAMLGGRAVDKRLYGSIALAVLAVWQGAKIIRTHDVKETLDAIDVCDIVQKRDRAISD